MKDIKTTKEWNNLIAEFMGYINTTPTDPCFNIYMNGDGRMIETMSMQYNSSWDWLMPVVEKINGNYMVVSIHPDSCTIDSWEDSIPEDYLRVVDDFVVIHTATYYRDELENGASTLIEAVYKSVVRYIKWYNLHDV